MSATTGLPENSRRYDFKVPSFLFLGSSPLAADVLRDLCAGMGHAPAFVVTQPDRPSGRGMRMQPTPVKVVAVELGLVVRQPESVNTPEFVQEVRDSGASFAMVVAFGQILSTRLLNALPKGFYNIHLSLLPELRGAAPVPWAVARGYRQTGVTCFRIVRELDAGPILSATAVAIAPDETTASLFEKLHAPVLKATRNALIVLEQAVELQEQDHSRATLAPKVSENDTVLDFAKPAWKLDALVRAFGEQPGTHCFWHKGYSAAIARGRESVRLRVLRVSMPVMPDTGHSAGAVIIADQKEGLMLQAGMGVARIDLLRPEGKKTMTGPEFVRGYRPAPGDRFLNY